MIEHRFPLEPSAADLEPWLDPGDVTEITPMPGWHNSVFQVDLLTGGKFVLRVHVPDEGKDFVAPTLRIANAYATRLSFVPAALESRNGTLMESIHGRTATLWPFVPGKNGETAELGQATPARCLGEIHRIGDLGMSDLCDLASDHWSGIDWRTNARWSLESAREFIRSHGSRFRAGMTLTRLTTVVEEYCDRIPNELGRIDAGEMVSLPIHGDFYPNNLIVGTESQIVAVIDWDEARIDWRCWDLANALLEFCARPTGTVLNSHCARELIGNYESAAPALTEEERNSLPLLVRARKFDELMYSLCETADGAAEDWNYLNWSMNAWLEVQNLEQL